MIERTALLEAIDDNLSELREGRRSISSRFRLRCDQCGNLVDRGLPVGTACPFFVGRGVKCGGILRRNLEYKS